jgi:hypothetical protein
LIWIGIPGTIDQTVGELLLAVPFFVSAVWDFFDLCGREWAELEKGEQALSSTFSVAVRDGSNAGTTLKNMDLLLDTLTADSVDRSRHFALVTFDMTQAEAAVNRDYRKQFDSVVRERAKTERSLRPLRTSAQTSIASYRQAIEGLARVVRTKNQLMRQALNGCAAAVQKIADRLERAATTLALVDEKVDFDADFRQFIQATNLARFDLPDLEFVPYPTASAAFADFKLKMEFPPSQVYPIGMARVVQDYYPSGPNQLACKSGNFLFLMEQIADAWVYVLNPNTLLTGFVPRFCLEAVGRGLGVMLRDQGGALIGDCVAIMDEAPHGEVVVETAFGHEFTVSKGNLGIIFTSATAE